jgi:hypothetical protein
MPNWDHVCIDGIVGNLQSTSSFVKIYYVEYKCLRCGKVLKHGKKKTKRN